MKRKVDRRTFIASTACASAGLALARGAVSGKDAVPLTMNIALIGAGNQGEELIMACVKMGESSGVRFRAVADIWTDFKLRRAESILRQHGHQPALYTDYREMLDEMPDLDAAIIATPDFCHARQSIDCMEAGLHVYCEAPMSHSIEEARRMVVTSRKSEKLLQIGHQRRSNPLYRHAKEKIIANPTLLGRLTSVRAQFHRPVEPDVGWSRRYELAPQALREHGYRTMHQFRNWMWYREYGNGPAVFFGVHQLDALQWFLGTAPASVTARGGLYYFEEDTHEWPDTVSAICEYNTGPGMTQGTYHLATANGFRRHRETFQGDRGTLEIAEHPKGAAVYKEPQAANWNVWAELGILKMAEPPMISGNSSNASAAQVHETQWPDRYSIPLEMTDPFPLPHLANFFNTIRGIEKLNCPAETGFAATVTVLKINEAIRTGRTLNLEPKDFVV